MNVFSNRRWVFAGFVVLVMLLLAMSIAGQWQLRRLQQVSEETLAQGQRAQRLQQIGVALWSLESDAERLLANADPQTRATVGEDLGAIDRSLALLASDAAGPAATQAALTAQITQLRLLLGRLTASSEAARRGNDDWLAVRSTLQQARLALRDASLDTGLRLQRAAARQSAIVGSLTLQLLVASVLVFAAALAAAFVITRSTARLHASLEGLRRSEADYRGIVANALEGIWRVGLDGRLLSANPAMARMLGYDSPAELLAAVTDVRRQVYLHAEDRDQLLPELLREGLLAGRELEFRRRDGRAIWVSSNTRVECDDSGRPLYLEAFITDITERKRAEQELRQHHDNLEAMVGARTAELSAAKERAEVASRAKSVFLASMSHELRTPLNAVLGYAQVLQHDRALGEPQRSRVRSIEQAGDHLLMLINEVLDLAKIEAGKLELQSEDIDVARVVEMVGDIARVKAEQKGLRFACELAKDLPPIVRGDLRRLRQVLLNLLDNAVKFTDRGQVLLRVQAPREGVLRFDVEDTGCGIAAANLDLIFQPFEQAGNTLLSPGGTGLGLSISRQLVGRMGGQLLVASRPGEGSRFWFELPLSATDGKPGGAPLRHAIVGYEGPPRRLLVVDDTPANRGLLVDWLTPLGFELDEAADGEEALARAAASPPDLVLMDSVMPGIDGLEATRRLHALPGLHRVPVIAISAGALQDDEQRTLAAGASAFVRKPIDLDALLVRIGSLLGLHWREETHDAQIEPDALPEPALVAPPHAAMVTLHRLAQRGNMREIRAFAEQLADAEPRLRPFAQRLLQLADAYQPTAILRLVTDHLD